MTMTGDMAVLRSGHRFPSDKQENNSYVVGYQNLETSDEWCNLNKMRCRLASHRL